MAVSHHFLSPHPPLLRRKSPYFSPVSPSYHQKWNFGIRTRLVVPFLPAKGLLKLRYASNGAMISESSQRYNMFDKSNRNTDDMDDLERQLQEFFVDIKTMLEKGNKDDAIDLLQANYEAVKEQMNDGSEGIEQACILDILALGYMGVGDLKLVEHLLDMLDELVGGLHDGQQLVDSILMHMGSMYTALGKFEDALHVYGRGLKILEKETGSCSPFLITPLMGMAKVFKLIGNATKSIAFYHRAVDILEKNRGAESEELVLPLSGLGNVWISEGKAIDAEACFNRILNIYRKIYGENDGRVGMAMCSLAHAMCAKGTIEEAICAYRSGLQVIKDSNYMTTDDDVLEKMRVDLAELLHVTGREEEGRELLRECLLVTEKYKGMEHPSSVPHLVNLATSYSRSKDFVEAERLLRTCLHVISRGSDSKDQYVSIPMLHLAVLLYHLNRDEEAEGLALEVVQIREGAFGKESLPVGEALDCLVSIQARLGKDYGGVVAKLNRILRIQEKEMGHESREVMETLKKVMFYLNKMGRKDEILPFQRRLSLLRTKYKHRVPVREVT